MKGSMIIAAVSLLGATFAANAADTGYLRDGFLLCSLYEDYQASFRAISKRPPDGALLTELVTSDACHFTESTIKYSVIERKGSAVRIRAYQGGSGTFWTHKGALGE